MVHTPGPLYGIGSVTHDALKARVWPVGYSTHVAVLHRVVVDIVAVPREVALVTDLVLPVALLPDGLQAFAIECGGAGGLP
jgi:hypothetical protein